MVPDIERVNDLKTYHNFSYLWIKDLTIELSKSQFFIIISYLLLMWFMQEDVSAILLSKSDILDPLPGGARMLVSDRDKKFNEKT